MTFVGIDPIDRYLCIVVLGYSSGFDFQMYAFLLLQVTDHCKQIARLGVPFRPEHAHETLARLFENPGQFLEPDRRVDIVTQHRLAGIDVTGLDQTYPVRPSSAHNGLSYRHPVAG